MYKLEDKSSPLKLEKPSFVERHSNDLFTLVGIAGLIAVLLYGDTPVLSEPSVIGLKISLASFVGLCVFYRGIFYLFSKEQHKNFQQYFRSLEDYDDTTFFITVVSALACIGIIIGLFVFIINL